MNPGLEMKPAVLGALFGLIVTSTCGSLNKGDGLRSPEPFNDTIIPRNSARPLGVECSTNSDSSSRNALIGDEYRWKSFNVYIDPAYTEDEQRMINNAMYQISQAFDCIDYGIWPPESSPTGDYVHMKRNDYSSCWSMVGKLGKGGMQEMSMAEGCMYHALLVHELLHAIGLEHVQSRSDRDDYVTIHMENVMDGAKHNFRKTSPREYDTHGVAYNQNSVMHYFGDSYSKNGQPTITSKLSPFVFCDHDQNGGFVGMEWPSGKIQDTDVQKLRRMYKC